MHLVCIYDYITVLQFCVGILLELPSNFYGNFLLESSKVPTIALPPARLRRKNDFEYPPLTLWIFSAEGLFLISRLSRSAERSKRYFHRGGRKRKRQMQRRFLRKRGAAGVPAPPGGAVAQRLRGYKWRSEKSVKAIAPTGAALAFLCFDFFFRIVKGVQPLARCGVGGVQR